MRDLARHVPNTGNPALGYPAQLHRPLYLVVTLLLLSSSLAACGGSGSHAQQAQFATAASAGSTATISLVAQSTAAATAPPAAVAPTATPETATEASPKADETAEPEPETSPITPVELQSTVDSLVSGSDGLTEVVIALPDGEFLVDYNGGESMESASLYKLGIMVEVYRERDLGLLTFDDGVLMAPGYFSEGEDVFGAADIDTVVDVGTLLNAMITVSSNVAATALLALVGNDNVNATLQSLGIVSTEIRWMPSPDAPADLSEDTDVPADDGTDTSTEPPADGTTEPDPTTDEPTPTGNRSGAILLSASTEPARIERGPSADARADDAQNVTTAEDIASLYVLLLRGEVISQSTSEEMLDLLASQEINDRIPAYLPEGTVVAHKTGNLDGLVHDAGVIYAPAGPIVVVVLTEDVEEGFAVDMIAQIALAAYEASS